MRIPIYLFDSSFIVVEGVNATRTNARASTAVVKITGGGYNVVRR